MTQVEQGEPRVDLPKMVGMFLRILPLLLVRLTKVFLRFKRQARKAGRVYQRELERQGVDKEVAQRLTESYLEGSDLSRMIRMIRPFG